MGQQRRDRTRDFFTLGWLLDPGAEDRDRALDAQQEATAMWLDERRHLPDAGDLFERERTLRADPSNLETAALRRDGEYQAGTRGQLQALQQLQGVANAGGYTPLERQQIADAQRQAAAYEQQQRAAQMQQMQMRGMAGGGAELASRLQAQQSGANRASADATQVATAAQMRALQAMQGSGQMAGQVQTSATNRANALDAFNQANTNRAQQVAQRNASGRQAVNQQVVSNRMNVLAGATGQYNTNANSAFDSANRQAEQVQGLIGGLLS